MNNIQTKMRHQCEYIYSGAPAVMFPPDLFKVSLEPQKHL